jgi:YD repeat-containing protein
MRIGEDKKRVGINYQFVYDLDNNRLSETITGGSTGNGSIIYTYNGDDQLKTETGTYTTIISNDYYVSYNYDANGNLTSETRTGNGATTNTYGYDLRNRMTTSTVNGVMTTYTYDTNGVLTSQTTGASATYYLNDPKNPTGYTKAIQESATLGGAATTSYVLGLNVVAQASSANGLAYLLIDGHGSTRALVNSSGAVISGQIYDYDAFGDALDFNASAAQTDWLANGDGFYDPASGWTYHLARWTNGFWFTQEDTIAQTPGDLANANLYAYLGGHPLNGWDPSGHFGLTGLLVTIGIIGIVAAIVIPGIYAGHPAPYFAAQIPAGPAAQTSGTFQFSYFQYSGRDGQRPGFLDHYIPGAPIPRGGSIIIVQASAEYGGFYDVSGRDPHIDIDKSSREYLSHLGNINSPLPGYGAVPGYPYNPLTVQDAPQADTGVRYFFTDVAYLEIGSTQTPLGAVNFEFDPSTGTTTIANGVTIDDSSTTSISVPAEQPGFVFTKAKAIWDSGQ